MLGLLGAARAQEDVGPTEDPNLWQFNSRPDLYPARLFVNTTEDGVTPGYIFMAPYQSFQNSATIYDSNGDVIWFGFGSTGSGNVHDFKVCQFNGSDHLCFTEGVQYRGYSRGQSVIMDTELQSVSTVNTLNGLSPLDQHEFVIADDNALIITYHPERYDLSAFNITTGQGWIMNSIFQDINLTTGELEFEWSAIEHIALTEGYVLPNTTEIIGTGFNPTSPWDYFHINSVDKNADGDYLISARHTSTLYKINGTDGTIIWRCGGLLSDFDLLNGLNWSYQHDARWMEYNDTTEIISLFDNASNGFDRSANHSAGYIIRIDHSAEPATVELLSLYPAADDQWISDSQGNMQVLNPDDWANSNTFIGWGSQPVVTEHDPEGNIIYRANVASNGMMNYRAYKFNITITPQDAPALYTYALDTDADTVYYMSWNGATEVRSWRIYGRGGCDGNWTLIDEVPKTGFETNFTAPGFQEYGMVEAVAGDGTGLRNSTNRGIKPFVPSPSLSESCTGDGCEVAQEYVVGSSQDVIAETRSACGALPVETVSRSTESSDNSNDGSNRVPATLFMVSAGLASTLLLMGTL